MEDKKTVRGKWTRETQHVSSLLEGSEKDLFERKLIAPGKNSMHSIPPLVSRNVSINIYY